MVFFKFTFFQNLIFTKASNSLITISILSHSIPVDITETRFAKFSRPVCATNSLLDLFNSPIKIF